MVKKKKISETKIKRGNKEVFKPWKALKLLGKKTVQAIVILIDQSSFILSKRKKKTTPKTQEDCSHPKKCYYEGNVYFFQVMSLFSLFFLDLDFWLSVLVHPGYAFNGIKLTRWAAVSFLEEFAMHIKRHMCSQFLMRPINEYPRISAKANIFHTTETSVHCKRVWCHNHCPPKVVFTGCILLPSFSQCFHSTHGNLDINKVIENTRNLEISSLLCIPF